MLIFYAIKGDSKKSTENSSLLPLRARKSDINYFYIVGESNNFRDNIQKRSKELTLQEKYNWIAT
jgi:hypothetical protein